MDSAIELIKSTLIKKCGFSALTRVLCDEDRAAQFFADFKLINLHRHICVCGAIAFKVKESNMRAGFRWACMNSKNCGQVVNPLQNTLFEHSNLSFQQVADLIVHWYFRLPFDLTVVDCRVSEPTVASWFKLFRKICKESNRRTVSKIGGPGQWVEIDEAHLFKRKYNRGRRVKGESIWIFGGICRETKQKFVVRVKNRKKTTLWPILKNRVEKGSILVTDGYKSYIGVKEALGFGAHEVVIHKDGFVDEFFREVFTNSIECVWSKIKKKVRNSGSNESVDLHLEEFLYRASLDLEYGRKYNYGIKFERFLKDLKKAFPGPHRQGWNI